LGRGSGFEGVRLEGPRSGVWGVWCGVWGMGLSQNATAWELVHGIWGPW
jgi:hypothetical protein